MSMATLMINQPSLAGLTIIAVYIVLWIFLSRLARGGAVSRAVIKVLHLAAWLVIGEWIKTLPAPAWAIAAVNGVQLALLAALVIQLAVNEYLGRYLAQRRGMVVNTVIRDLLRLLIVVVFLLIFLRYVLKLNLATILTPSAILTAIIGLSMQDTLGNLISGIVIQLEKPFDLNDWIEIEGLKGQVRELNWRYTKIETRDHLFIIVPNNKIAAEKLINHSKPSPIVEQNLEIGVSYDVPPVKVKRAILDILKANPHIKDKDSIAVYLRQYGDSSINYQITYTIDDTADERPVRDEVYSCLWYQFKQQGIEIPFPIRTVIMAPPAPAPDLSALTALLGKLAFFEGVSPDSLANLARFGLLHAVEPGYRVFDDREKGDTMFFVIAGRFHVIKDGQTVATLGEGEFFGEMALLTGEKRMARVEAAAPGRLLEIDRSAFKVLIETEPIMIRRVEKIFTDRVQAAQAVASDKARQPSLQSGLFNRFKQLFGL
jgi:small-conductance mechanosensitive channel